ncbi:MAG: hypothetical protein MI724_16145, partial [Spirochaetales bacterium]|nr:hypothetical protein [Spirochaetales bacterium]
ILVTIAKTIVLPAELRYLDPEGNFAFIQYDSTKVDASIETLSLSPTRLETNQRVHFIGITKNDKIIYKNTAIGESRPSQISFSNYPPRYRRTNVTGYTLLDECVKDCTSGVLIDHKNGDVVALWMDHARPRENKDHPSTDAITLTNVVTILEKLKKGEVPNIRVMPAEFQPLRLADAKSRKVPQDRIRKYFNKSGGFIFSVVRVVSFLDNRRTLFEGEGLREGDIVLELDGQIFHDLCLLEDIRMKSSVKVTVMRNGKELAFVVPTLASGELTCTEIVNFAGLRIQEPPLAVRLQSQELPSEVYTTSRAFGSPSALGELGPCNFIISVQGRKTHSIAEFSKVLKGLQDHEGE